MKKRLHDKKAGIAILISLIIISLAEIIFRAAAMGLEAVLTTANLGEQLAVVVLAVLIEYMTDGTICNRAFNVVCVATVLLLLFNIVSSILGAIFGQTMLFLETLHGLYRLAMIFMFTFFTYDSAKHQLKKTDLTK